MDGYYVEKKHNMCEHMKLAYLLAFHKLKR
jgi:hypothetical protein